MRIAVCDDEAIFREQLVGKLEKYFQSLDLIICTYASGEELLLHINDGQFDLVFLDIEMPGLDGLETARRVHDIFSNMPIIFLTSHVEFALAGYEVQAFRFLAKPIVDEKLVQALRDFEEMRRKNRKITILEEGMEKYLFCEDIYYIKSENVYLEIVMQREKHLIRKKLKEQLKELPADMFVAVHRSYIVNLKYVRGFDGATVMLEGGSRIPVSKSSRELFKQKMMRYMGEK